MIDVIYTFKQYKKNQVHLSPRGIDILRISVEASNRFYPTTLYCCKDSYEFFIKNKIPFGNIIVLDELTNIPKSETPIWSWPKIITMKYQTTRWLHLDFDTILTSPIEEYEDDFIFGYADCTFDTPHVHPATYFHAWDIYFWWFLKLHDVGDNRFNWDFKIIPNASFMYCNNPTEVSKAIKLFEKDNKWIIEKDNWDLEEQSKMTGLCCYFEQFLFTKYLKDNDVNVRILKKDEYNVLDFELLSNHPNEIQRWIDNGWFHFSIYKELNDISLNTIYNKLWKLFNIHDSRKFKLIL